MLQGEHFRHRKLITETLRPNWNGPVTGTEKIVDQNMLREKWGKASLKSVTVVMVRILHLW